jgi:DNA-binding transcriptional regulator YhcF (GntR family)
MLFSKNAYHFTESCRQALAAAREEAQDLRHEFVGTEHMLLGLLRIGTTDRHPVQSDGIDQVLDRLRVDGPSIRARVVGLCKPGAKPVSVRDNVPYTSRAKKSIELAMTAARDMGDDHVSAGHLLLGLLLEEKGVAAQVLAESGVTTDRIRAAMRGESAHDAAPVLRITIDDASDRSIYEQIVGQVQERIAVGDVRPGDRLPTVRQLADELDIAPGTVARAYSELEQRGVVITDGARGTRVAERARPTMSAAERPQTLVGLLRPVAVAAFHLGASAEELRAALDEAMKNILSERDAA